MRILILLSLIGILTGCIVQNPSLYQANSTQFMGKYKDFISKDEVEIASWYHYVKTINKKKEYTLRIFIPETKQITSKTIYWDENLSVLNGYSTYWFENGNVKEEGKYIKNKKEGIWKQYHIDSGELFAIGEFKKNKKTGKWKEFDRKGRLIGLFKYKSGVKEGEFIEFDTLSKVINSGEYKADTIYSQTKNDSSEYLLIPKEQPPYLIECSKYIDENKRSKCTWLNVFKYIYKNIKYPPNARKYGLEGKTITMITIDEEGNVKDLDVIIGLCQEFKEELTRVIGNMPKWQPAISNGKKVKVKLKIPVIFKLE